MNEEITHTAVVVLTRNYHISGCIDLLPGSRLTDYIGAVKSFFAVTDAVVRDIQSGKVVFAGKFMDVNRENVEIILPAGEITRTSESFCDE
ncbi:MAG: hypothetical protein KJ950_15705 [Proteobacteria bacterium]|nr:hypothetical protein [Pseudomonadota bacterium]MBU1688790.1 hypothetical protein [Pseudomonadota bacterium]